ncbi:MAG: transposase [Xanthomonadaceae bacterium]|nr:transposase [Xanthomonadaceae bacterium]
MRPDLNRCDGRAARWTLRAIGEAVSTPSPATLERAYRVRLRPTKAQARVLSRLFGAVRGVWNWALREKEAAWRADGTKLSGIDLSRLFTTLRQAPETAWLGELPREPFNQVLRNFDTAWRNFFSGRVRRPRRKRFGTVQSARFTLDQRRRGLVAVQGKHGSVQLDGIGRVRFRVSEPMQGRLRSVTVSRDGAGRWFACFTADGVPTPATFTAMLPSIGVDLGLRDTAALSTGEKVAAPKHLCHALATLRRYQRHYGRQRDAAARRQGLDPGRALPKGTRIDVSNRMRVTRQRNGRMHARIADRRRDHQHQLTARLVASAQVICIEDLAVKAMGRSTGWRAFRRSVGDAGLGEIRRQLVYKAAWRGRVVSAVGRFYPSSKTCSACGHVYGGLRRNDDHWVCRPCGAGHDRDYNAAITIEREGLRLLAEGSGGDAGSTRRSRGTDARGEFACAAGSSSPAGQPSSSNREPDRRAAPPPIPSASRDGPVNAGDG